MKKGKRILLAAVLVLVAAGAGFAMWQRNTIGAVYSALTMNEEEILQQLTEEQETQEQSMKEKGVVIPAPSAEELRDLLNGDLTKEELAERLGLNQWLPGDSSAAAVPAPQVGNAGSGSSVNASGTVSAPVSGTAQPSEEGQSQPEETVSAEDLYNQCVAELYLCEATVIEQLGSIRQETLAVWESLPAEEQTSTRKKELAFSALDIAGEMEGEIDGQVQEILSRYRTALSEIGGDTGVLDGLWDYYVSFKTTEKTYYMDQYL